MSHANYGEAFAPQIAAQFNIRTWSPITLSPLRTLAVVAVRERWRHALVAPDAFAGPLGVVPELLVAIGKIAINRSARSVGRWVIAVVDYGSRHTTEHGFDDVEELGTGREWRRLDAREAGCLGGRIMLIDPLLQLLGDVPRRRIP